eukprot:938052-Pelagomonas_calceolata.AAC.1
MAPLYFHACIKLPEACVFYFPRTKPAPAAMKPCQGCHTNCCCEHPATCQATALTDLKSCVKPHF